MGKRQRVWALKAREKLIQDLGGKCCQCGSLVDLEIDHPNGRNYSLRNMDMSWRVSRYRAEAMENKIRVLCSTCQKIYRVRVNQYIPNENNPF